MMRFLNKVQTFAAFSLALFVGAVTPCIFVKAQTLNTPTPEINTLPTADAALAATPTYGTMLSPELTTLAENALLTGQFEEAILIFKHLKSLEDSGWPVYGTAIALSQLGQYKKAFKTLGTLATEQTVYGKAAALLRGTLLLNLAEIAFTNHNLNVAQQNLTTFKTDHAHHPEQLRFNRLFLKLKKKHNAQSTQTDQTLKKTPTSFTRIGILLPLSGDLASIGKSLLSAMQLALFENDMEQVLLYPQDTEATPEGAIAAVQNLLNLGVEGILGPLSSRAVEAISPITQANRVPLFTFSSDIAAADKGVHILNYLPSDQTRAVVRRSFIEGNRRFAALVPSTPYGYETFAAFQKEVETLGGTVVTAQFFNPKKADVSASLEVLLQLDKARKILEEEKQLLEDLQNELGGAMSDEDIVRLKDIRKAEPTAVIDFEALFLPVDAKTLPLIAAQLAFYDVDAQGVQLLGTALWKDPYILKNRAEYLRGGLFAAPSINKAFSQNFQNIYEETPHPLAVLGYDAVKHMVSILQDAQTTNTTFNTQLLRQEGFTGPSGALRFHSNGQTERIYTLYQIKSRRFNPVQPAPELLPPPLPNPINPGKSRFFQRFQPW